jgi:uncharacterized repeat protein (TIGR03803 family)
MNRIGAIAIGLLSLSPFLSAGGILHAFDSTAWHPSGGLVRDAAGNLYGTTTYGGTNQSGTGAGTIFELIYTAPCEYTYSMFYAFKGYPTDGQFPFVTLAMDSSGDLYGTTYSGGSQDNGTVFELSPSSGAWIYKLLYSFPSVHGCAGRQGTPFGRLLLDSSGNLYGTTLYGGFYCRGTVFEISLGVDGVSEKDIYLLTGEADGAQPYGGLIADSTGNLYGNAQKGGLGGYGVVA